MPNLLAIFGLPGGMEWLVILIIGLLIFGGRLPSVARSIGKSIVEFKRGLKDVKDDMESADRPPDEPRPPKLPGPSASSSARVSEANKILPNSHSGDQSPQPSRSTSAGSSNDADASSPAGS